MLWVCILHCKNSRVHVLNIFYSVHMLILGGIHTSTVSHWFWHSKSIEIQVINLQNLYCNWWLWRLVWTHQKAKSRTQWHLCISRQACTLWMTSHWNSTNPLLHTQNVQTDLISTTWKFDAVTNVLVYHTFLFHDISIREACMQATLPGSQPLSESCRNSQAPDIVHHTSKWWFIFNDCTSYAKATNCTTGM